MLAPAVSKAETIFPSLRQKMLFFSSCRFLTEAIKTGFYIYLVFVIKLHHCFFKRDKYLRPAGDSISHCSNHIKGRTRELETGAAAISVSFLDLGCLNLTIIIFLVSMNAFLDKEKKKERKKEKVGGRERQRSFL